MRFFILASALLFAHGCASTSGIETGSTNPLRDLTVLA